MATFTFVCTDNTSNVGQEYVLILSKLLLLSYYYLVILKQS